MPNPTGANGDGVNRFSGFGEQPGYGDKKRQGELARVAPQAGRPGAASALNAPRRAQRHATGQDAAADQAAAAAPPAGSATIPASITFWTQAAQLPGASDLVLELANAAAGR